MRTEPECRTFTRAESPRIAAMLNIQPAGSDPRIFPQVGYFQDIPAETIRTLFELGIIARRHNASPTSREFVEFIDTHPGDYQFEGYVVFPPREDARVCIDGITARGVSGDEEFARFKAFAKYADDLYAEPGLIRAWWD